MTVFLMGPRIFASSAALRPSSSMLFIIMVTSAADNKNVGIEVKCQLFNSGAVTVLDGRRADSGKAKHGPCSHAGI